MSSLRTTEKYAYLEPLLNDGDDVKAGTSASQSHSLKRGLFRSSLSWLLLHFCLIVIYSAAFFIMVHNARSETSILTLPAREAIISQLRAFSKTLLQNPFTGPPRPELEQAWHDLRRNDNVQVPASSLQLLCLTSIPVASSPNVIASLGFFHALHCLKKTRHMVFRDHYHAEISAEQMLRETLHVEHCIEYIREYLTCHPDISLVTFRWINETHPYEPGVRMPTTQDRGMHECANWDALDAWAGERAFDLFDVEKLVKPKVGLEYD